ncbi:GntR family transcriptional regulator [Pseudovibrio flavus]|uniref:GntR family transcriptional regulator n=1 Tax=Pseudovibrio flavus TaxID=2529854 RepID=UPI00211BA899|nr:GntR family transcriptional regulator [Pseudovibrio flavus]
MTADRDEIPQTTSLSDAAYDRIKADIVKFELKPGQEITESKLVETYGIGKAPIRTALLRLCHERLVESLPRRGYVVAPITIRDVIDIYELRLLLEPEAARLAAGRVKAERLMELNEACEQACSSNEPDAPEKYLELNTRFHLEIAMASGNHRLISFISSLLDESQRIRHMGLKTDNGCTKEYRIQHTQLIEALISGDGALAAEITERHIRAGREMTVRAVLSGADILDRPISPAFDKGAGKLLVIKRKEESDE